MSNTPYGLSALMEAVNYVDQEAVNLEAIHEAMFGVNEFTLMDAEDAGLVDEDEVNNPATGPDDIEDTTLSAQEKKFLDELPPADDIPSMNSVDEALESLVYGL